MQRLPVLLISLALLLPTWLGQDVYAQSAQPAGLGNGPCGLASPAFCDTFATPTTNTTNVRVGDLDGVVWGASRFGGNVSAQGVSDEWEATRLDYCGTTVDSALPPQDIRICNGQVVEAANDHGGTLGLAAYPKQPFDFAGRVGTVTFDVGDDSQGTHAAWPMFVLTDQPVPVPHPNVVDPTTWNLPNNAIGVSLAAGCNGSCPGTNFPPGGQGSTGNCVTTDEAWTVTNHQLTTYGVFQGNGFTIKGCVIKGTVGHLNHFAINFSQTSPNIQVWATDADSTAYRLIAEGDNMTLPLTRGLTWLEDNHYNGCKDQTPGPQCQQQHTFAWDNWGFDGPILPRDLTFDVPDNSKSLGLDPATNQQSIDLGFLTTLGTGKLTVNIPSVTHVENAVGALLVFNTQPVNSETVTYAVNGHAARSFNVSPSTVSNTVAVPVTLSDLVDGTNAVILSASDTGNFTAFANIDLILQGAGGSGSPTPTPSATLTTTPTDTLTPTPPATPVATQTATPTPPATETSTPVATDTPTGTSTPAPTETATATPTPVASCVLQASQGSQVIWTAVVPDSACGHG